MPIIKSITNQKVLTSIDAKYGFYITPSFYGDVELIRIKEGSIQFPSKWEIELEDLLLKLPIYLTDISIEVRQVLNNWDELVPVINSIRITDDALNIDPLEVVILFKEWFTDYSPKELIGTDKVFKITEAIVNSCANYESLRKQLRGFATRNKVDKLRLYKIDSDDTCNYAISNNYYVINF